MNLVLAGAATLLMCSCRWFDSTPIPADDAGEDAANDETTDSFPDPDSMDDDGAADLPDLPDGPDLPSDGDAVEDIPDDGPDLADADEPETPAPCPFEALFMLVEHSCALTASSEPWCWGKNDNGELGDGTTVSRPYPVQAASLASSAKQVFGGVIYTCAMIATEGLVCLGGNEHGQLGNGTTTDSLIAVDVTGLTSGVALADGGYHHMCAVTTANETFCWGWNNYGQLGDGTVIDRSAPSRVTTLSEDETILSLSAGGYHSCVVTGSGVALCWGNTVTGQIGSGSVDLSPVPLAVGGLAETAAAAACGRNHTCLVLESGGVACFGRNANGELGNGTFSESAAPVAVTGLSSGVTDLQAGNYHNCVLTSGGGVKCWGWNHTGQLGDGTLEDRGMPVDVTGLTSGVGAISVGSGHTCALLLSGEILCWGSNDSGELGNGTLDDATVPTALRCE
jgi:alpha-tubulin suppressor-like RCC1 family protein